MAINSLQTNPTSPHKFPPAVAQKRKLNHIIGDSKMELPRKGSKRERSRSRSSRTTMSFSRRCARLVKEQRARFYIMRRCITMLVCWRDYP
ncbi:hypothetical protein Cni_G05676 [Canna indica]|uniref:ROTUNDIFOLIA like 8 n=1 Tax=Canna indica TaxID=4628 RepID=A0AAQ3Q3Y9_9LILI|nr:hypothetical protein Cni_G05676 [Canna indica]